jgi:hypothetical protein
MRNPRKSCEKLSVFAHDDPRLFPGRLGLGQHYREAVFNYCGNPAEWQAEATVKALPLAKPLR